MNVLAFDGRMGAAGDMLLGALIAAGADAGVLEPVEDALPVTYAIGESTKNGIRATRVEVRLDAGSSGDERPSGDDEQARDHEHGTHTGHAERPDTGHGHDDGDRDYRDSAATHGHGHGHAEGAGPHRTYHEVVDVVESMELPASIETDALAVFERLGEAEATVHGTDLGDTHFHEVGADDAIADVVGTALLLADLAPDRVVTTPVAAGGGEVEMEHGRYPVPTPAVVEIAAHADWELRGGPVEVELLTPTGAAILAEVAEGVDSLPPLRVEASGYGAGSAEFPDHPNVIRAIVGDGGTRLRREEIRVLETAVDDVSPELLGGLQETLVDVGARDVSIAPLTMKKSRPGHLIRAIVRPADVERVAARLAEETGTLGVRETGATHRWIADREIHPVSIEFGGERYEVDVKVATDTAGVVYDVSVEYDDAVAVAREIGEPIREVMSVAEAVARDRWS